MDSTNAKQIDTISKYAETMMPTIVEWRNGVRPVKKSVKSAQFKQVTQENLIVEPLNEKRRIHEGYTNHAQLHIQSAKQHVLYSIEIVDPSKIKKLVLSMQGCAIKNFYHDIPSVINISDIFYNIKDYLLMAYTEIAFDFYGDFTDLIVFKTHANIDTVERDELIATATDSLYENSFRWFSPSNLFTIKGDSHYPFSSMRIYFNESVYIKELVNTSCAIDSSLTTTRNTSRGTVTHTISYMPDLCYPRAYVISDIYGISITAGNGTKTCIPKSCITKGIDYIEFQLPIWMRCANAGGEFTFQVLGIRHNTRLEVILNVYNTLLCNPECGVYCSIYTRFDFVAMLNANSIPVLEDRI